MPSELIRSTNSEAVNCLGAAANRRERADHRKSGQSREWSDPPSHNQQAAILLER